MLFPFINKVEYFLYHQMYIICKIVSFPVIEFDNKGWTGQVDYGSHTYFVAADLDSSQVLRNFKQFSAYYKRIVLIFRCFYDFKGYPSTWCPQRKCDLCEY